MDEIRRIQPNEVDDVGAMLGRAFAGNPPFRAIYAEMNDAERERALVRVKRGFVRASVDHHVAEALVHDGVVVAASLVCDPGTYPVSAIAKAKQVWGCALTGPRAWPRLLAFDSFLAKRHMKEAHFYLFVLGVEPAMQGRGFGKVLLRRFCARADAERLPSWLETDKETSVRLYESVGFEVVANERCRVGDVPMWFMRRPPQQS